jgi:shikimate dehydrogenase
MKLYGLIGYPLGHSFSEKYFTEKFRNEGIKDCSFRMFPLNSISLLPELIKSEPDLCGFNVTIPYKVDVMKYLHSIDPVAEEIGAVNNVKITRSIEGIKLTGNNTDAPAFKLSLEKNITAKPATALILGTGGAAACVWYVLENMGVAVKIVSRGTDKGNLTYNDITPSLLKETDLIVNATPLGMYPDTDNCAPIDYDSLNSHQTLYDLIYNPEKTEFLKRGERQGCKIINGKEMFHLQAEYAWQNWNK